MWGTKYRVLTARGICCEKFVSGVDLLDIIQIVVMEPELRDCDDIWGVFVDGVLKVMQVLQ